MPIDDSPTDAAPEAAAEMQSAAATGADGGNVAAKRRGPRLRRFLSKRLLALAGSASALIAVAIVALALARDPGPSVTLVLDGPGVFRELPKLTTDLRPSGGRKHFVSVAMVVEMSAADLARLDAEQTAVVDSLQALLRDYDREDLTGRDGAQRVRADALHAINRILAPARARGLLFKEFLVD